MCILLNLYCVIRYYCCSLQNDDGIQKEEKRILEETKSNMADNIALVVLSPDPSDGTTDDEVLEALKEKYDALKDKLLAEALLKEVCT